MDSIVFRQPAMTSENDSLAEQGDCLRSGAVLKSRKREVPTPRSDSDPAFIKYQEPKMTAYQTRCVAGVVIGGLLMTFGQIAPWLHSPQTPSSPPKATTDANGVTTLEYHGQVGNPLLQYASWAGLVLAIVSGGILIFSERK